MIRGLKTRINLMRGLFPRGEEFAPSPIAVLRQGVLRRRCTRIGPQFVQRLERVVDGYWVSVVGCNSPLFWPVEAPLFGLYKVLTEIIDPTDWHHYEVSETPVENGDTVLDCGAGEGLFALRCLGKNARCFAFEPSPMWQRALRRTFENTSVEVVRAALGSSSGAGTLSGEGHTGQVSHGRGGSIDINILALDDWAAVNGVEVRYIKADVEGAEEALLRGGLGVIERDHPKVSMTVYHSGNDWRVMVDLLKHAEPAYRFKIKGLSYNGGKRRPVMLHAWVD
jgi:FkbM family methyltransferase